MKEFLRITYRNMPRQGGKMKTMDMDLTGLKASQHLLGVNFKGERERLLEVKIYMEKILYEFLNT